MSQSFDATHPVIGYLVPEFPNQTHAFFWRELSALRDDGVTLDLLSTRRPPEDACPHDFADTARAETTYLFPPSAGAALSTILTRPAGLLRAIRYAAGLRESGLGGRLKVLAMLPVAAALVARAKTRGLDHVHVHSCANAAHIAALAHALDGLPYSLTLHGHLPVYGTDHVSKFRAARFVSTVTRPLHNDVSALLPGLPVPVIAMGVDTDKFQPPASSRAGGNGVTFLSISRLHWVKGHLHFLRVLRRMRDEGLPVRYVIAGDGPAEADVRKAIDELDLSDVVTLLGTIGESRVIDELRKADAFVLTSYGQGEAAPVAVMEAMATGLPVICSRIGGTADMIDHDTDGLLVGQQDEDDIHTAARRLATDPALRARLGAAARDRALRQFDYRAQARRLYAEISAQGRQTG